MPEQAEHKTTPPEKQMNAHPRRHGDAWVVYPDGSRTGLMPRSEARQYARLFGGVMFRLPPRTWIGRVLRVIGI